ncbi:hypothetical protein BC628DRAFT_1181677 [Trametes gibbosa]|nr:hypothetical protein BC628DRAFT_1181677 [Trametes gibbosa]
MIWVDGEQARNPPSYIPALSPAIPRKHADTPRLSCARRKSEHIELSRTDQPAMDLRARQGVKVTLPTKGKALRWTQGLDDRGVADRMAQSRSRVVHRCSGRKRLAWNPAPPPTSSNNIVRLSLPTVRHPSHIRASESLSGPEGAPADMTLRFN